MPRLQELSQSRPTPPSSAAPAAINIAKESSTTICMRQLEQGDFYEPGIINPRSHQNYFRQLEDVDDDFNSDLTGDDSIDRVPEDDPAGENAKTPKATSRDPDDDNNAEPIEDPFVAILSQVSRTTDTDAPHETLTDEELQQYYDCLQHLEAGGAPEDLEDRQTQEAGDDFTLPDSGPSIVVRGSEEQG